MAEKTAGEVAMGAAFLHNLERLGLLKYVLVTLLTGLAFVLTARRLPSRRARPTPGHARSGPGRLAEGAATPRPRLERPGPGGPGRTLRRRERRAGRLRLL